MEPMLRILHLEDDPLDSALTRKRLREEGLAAEIDRVDTLATFATALERGGYALILSDYTIPGMDSLEALRLARQKRPEVPFICLSGTIGEDVAIETLKLGASDYVLKQRLARLAPAVRRALQEAEEQARRRQAEQELRKFRFFSEHANDAHLLSDDDTRILYANRLACERLGYSEAELLQLTIPDIDPVFPKERVRALIEACKHGRVPPFEAVHRRKDGSTFPVEITSTVLELGGQWLMFSTVRDITERKRAEQALRESERQFRGTFENAAVGMTHIDLEGRWLRVNRTLCQTLGYSEQELQGRHFSDLTYPEDREADAREYDRLVRGEVASYAVEKRYIRKDGRPVWVRVTRSAQRDEDGRVAYCISINEDITPRKEAEAVAEAASRAKDEFLAVLSHELRTPLTPVLAAASAAAEDPGLDAEQRQNMEVIRRNVELEARLIDDLLDVTRIARGKVELDRRPVAICTILQRAAEVCQPEFEAHRVHFGMDIRNAPHLVEADASRMQQVFWNLLNNAVKFTPPGGCIGLRCWRDGDSHVVTEVSDSGEGIEPEVLPRIFTPFEQGTLRTRRQFGGLGLGLTIAKALVEMHGGTIAAHSDGKGKGATFAVRLPVTASHLPAAPTPSRARPQSAPRSPKSLHILLVEDHADTARIMRRLLRAQGHQVQIAGDVATALQFASAKPFDVLVSDLGLPDRSGLDLMRELRARGSTLPGIALSGYGQEQDIEQSHQVGFAAHLTKPVSVRQLQDAIDGLAAKPPTGEPSPLPQLPEGR